MESVDLHDLEMTENDTKHLPLALTCGDPAGVGPEVIESCLRADALGGRDCVLIGPKAWASRLAECFGIEYIGLGSNDYSTQAGAPDLEGARIALESLEVAAHGCDAGKFRGVVTAPVSKHWLAQVGFKHPGQTEFFAEAWGGNPSMGFVGEYLRVVLATWHIPLSGVSEALTAECLTLAVERAVTLGKSLGIAEPRIGVCGLNPHAGENGLIGREELDVLDPALDILRKKHTGLSKCLPGDTVFYRQKLGAFDVVVAMYHDQGLAAVKTLEFDKAVNVTLGLRHVRTSPDHGTAFDLAGTGRADSSSFEAALKLARRLT